MNFPLWSLPAKGLLIAAVAIVHVFISHFAVGGGLFLVLAERKARRERDEALLGYVRAHSRFFILLTLTMGVAALLFLQALYGRLFFTAAVLLAAPWIAVVPILIAGYYAAYAGRSTPRPWFAWLVALAFLAVAFIYANTTGLLLRPEVFLSRFQASASGLHLDLADSTLAPRFLHVVLASLAVSGLAVAGADAFLRRNEPEVGAWMARRGVLVFTSATTLNFVPGVWWLAALPRDVLLMFVGRDLAATGCLTVGLLSALAAIGFAIPAGFPPAEVGGAAAPRRTRPFPPALLASIGCLTLSVVSMALVRDFARSTILRVAGVQLPSATAPQWGPMAVFAVLLLAAIGTVGWMVARLLGASARVEETVSAGSV